MKAMVFRAGNRALVPEDIPIPVPSSGEVLVKVESCGVCRTDLHIVDGELRSPKLPLVPGHQIVGTVEHLGKNASELSIGDRVGVPWLGWTCGICEYCTSGRENLCTRALFTGYTRDGGFAEFAVVDSRYCFLVPDQYDSEHAAPLLCAGLIGYRALRFAGDARTLGFYGFGSAAHILTRIAQFQNRQVYAFTRPGDKEGAAFAGSVGAVWAGGSDEPPPQPLDAAIIFAPVGALVPAALKAVKPAGMVVCAGIHMSDIPAFPYSFLWMERSICSVANLTREDGRRLFELASEVTIETSVQSYPLERVNDALNDLRAGKIAGSAVVKVS